ncbi:epoxide hydrolase family protein [Micromonospora palythoicola]|uniref:epoxide hydrolase family protein n=1 Tax=Micromonospora palythoicola TaxID=3120507 RepID=UPI002FCDE74D
MTVRPYTVDIPGPVIDDLRDRLRGTRWPDQIGEPWEYGTDLTYLRSLLGRWAEGYDWFAHQRRLNTYAHHLVDVGDDTIHVIREPARTVPAPGALPVVLLHGWPSSFVQLLPMLSRLVDPAGHGGDPADAVDAVVISLPGYGFSSRPRQPGADTAHIADQIVEVMAALGHRRFVGRGSDLGAGVLQQMALRHPQAVAALHLSGTNPYLGWVPDDLSDAEKRFVEDAKRWNQSEMAYAQEHATKPQTLAYALNDSPAGLAAWVIEKFRRWSDCGGDLDSVYDRDDLLTNLTIYWATQTIGSSMRLYYETAHSTGAAWGRVEVPTAMAMSSADMFPTPREWVERQWNVVRWTDLPRGGHFLEWEVPELLASDLHAFLREQRTNWT